jgi:hypothetical protein
MAGSYSHAINEDGSLRPPEEFVKLVENLGDAYETVEEMYGMIWWLSHALRNTREVNGGLVDHTEKQLVKLAQISYKSGIVFSPTDRPAQF